MVSFGLHICAIYLDMGWAWISSYLQYRNGPLIWISQHLHACRYIYIKQNLYMYIFIIHVYIDGTRMISYKILYLLIFMLLILRIKFFFFMSLILLLFYFFSNFLTVNRTKVITKGGRYGI